MVNPALAMLIVVGLFVWILFHPNSTAPVKIFLMIVAVLIFGPLSITVMNRAAAAFPWKFDYHLYLIDNSLWFSAFWVARHLVEWQRSILFVIYETLGYWMIVWYGLNLLFKSGQPRQLVVSFLLSYGFAPLFYLAVPACGPRHAFGAIFPAGNPVVSAVPVQLAFWPNAIPSLHLASALILVHFSGDTRFWRCFAWLYLAGTVAATLAFEHYLIDLVVAVPYAYFAICLAEGRFRATAAHTALVLAWLASIRFGTPLLIQFPLFLNLAAAGTIAAGVISARSRRMSAAGKPDRAANGVQAAACRRYPDSRTPPQRAVFGNSSGRADIGPDQTGVVPKKEERSVSLGNLASTPSRYSA
jgi:hypothetical protein